MLNDENNEGRTTSDYEAVTTTVQSHHPASTTSKHGWRATFEVVKRWISVSKNIDFVSRRIFPATFLLFNIVYWSVYLSPPHYHCDLKLHGIDLHTCFNTTDPLPHYEAKLEEN